MTHLQHRLTPRRTTTHHDHGHTPRHDHGHDHEPRHDHGTDGSAACGTRCRSCSVVTRMTPPTRSTTPWRPNAAGRRALLHQPGRPRRHRRPAGRRRGPVGVGGAARRHVAQRRRRPDRGAAAGRVQAGAPAGEQALHLRLRPGRGPRRAVRRRDDRPVQRRSPPTRPSTGCSTHERSPTCGRSPPQRSIGFLGNEIVARYRIRVGRRIGSAALVADGLHARTDGFTSLAVLLGAGGVALGLAAGPTPWSVC